MKKSMKSAFALMLTMIMILGVMPAAMAAELTSDATVTTFGEGVSYFNESCSAELLTNGYYYTSYEVGTKNSDSTGSDHPNTDTQKAELVTFTQADSGIEYEWTDDVPVKRLEVWILGYGGVKTYEVQKSEDGETGWTTVKSGSFKSYENLADNALRASYYPIIFDSTVTTKHLRFVIKSFQNETDGAKIAETRVSDTNEINLGVHPFFNVTTNVGVKGGSSPYLWGFNASSSNRTGNAQTSSDYLGTMWPYHASKTLDASQIIPDASDATEGLWYVTTFDRSAVKVNKVGLTLRSGQVYQFEVWASPDYVELKARSSDPSMPDTTNWTKLATIDCNLGYTSTDLFELPKAIEATAYLFKVTDYNNAYINSFPMYAVADSELTPAISDAALTGEVAAGNTVTFSALSTNNKAESGKVFFALYSGDELYDVDIEDCSLTGAANDAINASYTIPAEATGELSIRVFVWDLESLKPILTEPFVPSAS